MVMIHLLAALLAIVQSPVRSAGLPQPNGPSHTIASVVAKAGALTVFHNRLVPYTMMHSRCRQVTLLSGVATEGLHLMGGLPEEPWLLLSFYAVPDARPRVGSDLRPCPDTDMPLMIRFQHQPLSATLTGDGLKLTFRRECGYIWIMPLFGRGHLPLRQTQTWPDSSQAYQAAVEKCRYWAGTMVAPPIGRGPLGGLDRLEIEDDWGTKPTTRGIERPAAELAGSYTTPSVVTVPGESCDPITDLYWPTCRWPQLMWPQYRTGRGGVVHFGTVSPDLLRVPVCRRQITVSPTLTLETCSSSAPISSLPSLDALPDDMRESAARYAADRLETMVVDWEGQRNQKWLASDGSIAAVQDGELALPPSSASRARISLSVIIKSPSSRIVQVRAGKSARAWVGTKSQPDGRLLLVQGTNRVTISIDPTMESRLLISDLHGLPSPGLRFTLPHK